jgi:hypothetical protein
MEDSKNHQIFYQTKKKSPSGDFSPEEKGLPPIELCLASVFLVFELCPAPVFLIFKLCWAPVFLIFKLCLAPDFGEKLNTKYPL